MKYFIVSLFLLFLFFSCSLIDEGRVTNITLNTSVYGGVIIDTIYIPERHYDCSRYETEYRHGERVKVWHHKTYTNPAEYKFKIKFFDEITNEYYVNTINVTCSNYNHYDIGMTFLPNWLPNNYTLHIEKLDKKENMQTGWINVKRSLALRIKIGAYVNKKELPQNLLQW